MATSRFKTTTEAIQGGLKDLGIEKGVQNIEGWEDYLHKHDGEGVKAVLADLGKLKKLLQAKEVDSDAVKKLLEKVGKDTVKAAGKEETADAKHIRELGEALSSAASDDEDDDEEVAGEDELVDVEDDDDASDDDEEVDVDDEEDDVDDEDLEDEDDEEDEDEPARASKAAAKKAAKKAPAKAAKKTKS